MHEGVQDMPIKRYNLLNLYMLKDAGIGATAQGISERFKTFFSLLKQKDYNGLSIEATNIVFSLNSILEGVNYDHYSFLCFVTDIDGKPITTSDVENDNTCKQILSEIADWLTIGKLNELNNDSKKKINKELKLFFPNKYSQVNDLLYFQQLKTKIEIQLNRLIKRNPALYEAQMLTVEKYFLQLDYPKEMRAIKGNAIVEQLNYFELLCTLLEENGISKPKELTLFEFMSKINYLEEKFNRNKK